MDGKTKGDLALKKKKTKGDLGALHTHPLLYWICKYNNNTNKLSLLVHLWLVNLNCKWTPNPYGPLHKTKVAPFTLDSQYSPPS